jgi:predicted HTH domain antitoxin
MWFYLVPNEISALWGPQHRLPHAVTEAVAVELLREHRIATGKAAEPLELSYRRFLVLLQTMNILVATPPSQPEVVANLRYAGRAE